MPRTAETPTGNITIRIDDEQLERKFRRCLRENDDTASQVLRGFIRQYVAEHQKPRREKQGRAA